MITNRKTAMLIWISILLAYSMLVYSLTWNKSLWFITDLLSWISVILIPILLYKYFKNYKELNYFYMFSRFVEWILMIIWWFLILNPEYESFRNLIYEDIHIYFFISGALFFYILLYKTKIVKRYISIWWIIATIMLFIMILLQKIFWIESMLLWILVLPIVLNEIYLAFYLIIKGFKIEK